MKKLQNKKTGEIGYLIVSKGSDYYAVTNDNWESCGEYDSLAKLNEEWEDYEEPKVYYYISDFGAIRECEIGKYPLDEEDRKQIGNYFLSLEETEKAGEKLEAWKRLKDKGFKFYGWNKGSLLKGIPNNITFACDDTTIWDWEDIREDLDLLFGGEE